MSQTNCKAHYETHSEACRNLSLEPCLPHVTAPLPARRTAAPLLPRAPGPPPALHTWASACPAHLGLRLPRAPGPPPALHTWASACPAHLGLRLRRRRDCRAQLRRELVHRPSVLCGRRIALGLHAGQQLCVLLCMLLLEPKQRRRRCAAATAAATCAAACVPRERG
eukprot:213761-Chlamydomonas_euryale.AAC.5